MRHASLSATNGGFGKRMKVPGDFLKARHTHTLCHRRGSEGARWLLYSLTGATGAGLGLLQQYIRQRKNPLWLVANEFLAYINSNNNSGWLILHILNEG